MRDLARNLYRHAPEAVLVKADGTRTPGRGAVVRMKAPSGQFMPGLAAEPGVLGQPLFAFTGWMPGARAGDSLEQGGARYRVLSAEELGIGGKTVCLRAVCEKEDAGEGA